jgi:hypothetical protein
MVLRLEDAEAWEEGLLRRQQQLLRIVLEEAWLVDAVVVAGLP